MNDPASSDRPNPSDRTVDEETLAAEIGRLVCEKRFCAAARLYSEMTGADLLDSKLAIDRLAHRHGHAPISGCASYFGLILVLAGTGAWSVIAWISSPG